MRTIRYTLVAEGAGDRCLLRIIGWTLREHLTAPLALDEQFADPRDFERRATDLSDKIRLAWRAFPCDLLFVHRDGDGETTHERRSEIMRAAVSAGVSSPVCVVPVRMTEAWLLFDQTAIRHAADKPDGTTSLGLPKVRKHDAIADPKRVLREALVTASEKSGWRLERFKRDIPKRVLRVAELIESFAPLRELAAFREFEDATRAALDS